MRFMAFLVLMSFAVVVNAEVREFTKKDCTDMGFMAADIARDYEAGMDRVTLIQTHILDRKKLQSDSFDATAPYLLDIIYELQYGLIKVPAKDMWSTVYRNCRQKVGVALQY